MTTLRSVRAFESADEFIVAALSHRCGQLTHTYLPTWQSFTLDHAPQVFHDVIVGRCDIRVGPLEDRGGKQAVITSPYDCHACQLCITACPEHALHLAPIKPRTVEPSQ